MERLFIRISYNDLSFAARDLQSKERMAYEQYSIHNGIAMAANFRNALKDGKLLSYSYKHATTLINSPVLLIPLQEFNADDVETLYHYTITGMEGNLVMYQELPNLNAVAIFCINKDLKLVIDEHFDEAQYLPLAYPVWNHLHRHSFTGVRKKLYVYFHDKQMEVCSFDKNRFKFCNSFDADNAHDAVYYILYVWQQLGYNAQHDEIHIMGNVPETEWMMEVLHHHVQKVVHNLQLSIDNNQIPFDLQVLFAEQI
ncbi:MAG: DUF3822 family protein [Prevotella sp.]|nr:DUF3822 family protein [Prevotella sp.]